MARHSSLRAADADREAVTERLRQAAGEGRLEPEELEDRLHATLRARTYGELDRVSPICRRGRRPVPCRGRAARRADAPSRSRTRVSVALVVVTLVLVEAALTVMWWLLWALMRAARVRRRPHRRAPAGLA